MPITIPLAYGSGSGNFTPIAQTIFSHTGGLPFDQNVAINGMPSDTCALLLSYQANSVEPFGAGTSTVIEIYNLSPINPPFDSLSEIFPTVEIGSPGESGDSPSSSGSVTNLLLGFSGSSGTLRFFHDERIGVLNVAVNIVGALRSS